MFVYALGHCLRKSQGDMSTVQMMTAQPWSDVPLQTLTDNWDMGSKNRHNWCGCIRNNLIAGVLPALVSHSLAVLFTYNIVEVLQLMGAMMCMKLEGHRCAGASCGCSTGITGRIRNISWLPPHMFSHKQVHWQTHKLPLAGHASACRSCTPMCICAEHAETNAILCKICVCTHLCSQRRSVDMRQQC